MYRYLAICASSFLIGCSSTGDLTGATLAFEVRNEYVLAPTEGDQLRAWLAIPGEDDLQRVSGLRVEVDAPGVQVSHRQTVGRDGNRALFVEARGVAGKKIRVTTTFDVVRRAARTEVDAKGTRPIGADERKARERYLSASTNIKLSPTVVATGRAIVGTEQNPRRTSAPDLQLGARPRYALGQVSGSLGVVRGRQ